MSSVVGVVLGYIWRRLDALKWTEMNVWALRIPPPDKVATSSTFCVCGSRRDSREIINTLFPKLLVLAGKAERFGKREARDPTYRPKESKPRGFALDFQG